MVLLAGFYGRRGRWVYVSRGIGYIWKIRVNAAPEISCFTLRPERHRDERPNGYCRWRRHTR